MNDWQIKLGSIASAWCLLLVSLLTLTFIPPQMRADQPPILLQFALPIGLLATVVAAVVTALVCKGRPVQVFAMWFLIGTLTSPVFLSALLLLFHVALDLGSS